MYRLINHFFNISLVLLFVYLIIVIVLYIFKNKINNKVSRIILLCPLFMAIVHYIYYYVPSDFQFNIFLIVYIYPILIIIWQLFKKFRKVFRVFFYLLVVFGMFGYILTYYVTLQMDNLHVLTRYRYTNSFNKTIEILKKEYVLNEHKKIDYNYLYDKYYSLVKQAEENNDEELYMKTMYEFSSNFKDGHFIFNIYDEQIKNNFYKQYYNKDYGFGSILLSDGSVAAILVDKDSEAYKKGLRDGMIITKKDNVDIKDVMNDMVIPQKNYPVLEDELLFKSFYLFATGNEKVDVTFINKDDKEKNIEVSSISDENNKPEKLWNKVMYYNERLNNFDTKVINKNTGYMVINHENTDIFKGLIGYGIDDASYYMNELLDKKIGNLVKQGISTLILDLRNNNGGYLVEAEAIASMFTKDNYLVLKEAKYNSNLFNKSYLKGNGKYSNLKLVVLVNSNTISSGDILTYLLKKNENTIVIGFTNSNNSSQSIGGLILLSGGKSSIVYPTYKALDENDNIFIDPDYNRDATLKLDVRIKLNKENIKDIVYSNDEYDYLLEYVVNNYLEDEN